MFISEIPSVIDSIHVKQALNKLDTYQHDKVTIDAKVKK